MGSTFSIIRKVGFAVKEYKRRTLVLRGIINGKKAFAPPDMVEVELVNKCNLDCVGCNVHSRFLKSKKSPSLRSEIQDPSLLKAAIEDMSHFGVRTVSFNSNGEPFLYPHFLKFAQLVKDKRMGCNIMTNGIVINKTTTDQLCKIGVDSIKLNLWAGDPATYIRVHPNQTEKTFQRIRQWLYSLKRLKEKGYTSPKVYIVNAILNENYRNIQEMIDFAKEMSVEKVQFRLAYFYDHNIQKMFSLSKEQKASVLSFLSRIKREKQGIKTNLREFELMVAYRGKGFQRMDRGLPTKMPCYIGWLTCRIKTDGKVVPCGGCTDLVIGNLKEQSFKDIWLSPNYNRFRVLAKGRLKSGYLKRCLCHKNCCQYLRNLKIYRKLNPIGYALVKP